LSTLFSLRPSPFLFTLQERCYTLSSVAESKKKAKRGPEPERLKIDLDPQEGLRRLLRAVPPPKKQAKKKRDQD